MRTTGSSWLLGIGAALVLTACSAAEDTASAGDERALAGWYMQSAGQDSFQPCGGSERWQIGRAADLHARAKAFGLADDTPVYVRLQVTIPAADKTIDVVRVEQFGSPTPVRDCALTGVVHQAVTA